MFEETNNYVLPKFMSKVARKYVRKHSNRFSKEVRLRTVFDNVDTGLIVIRMVNVLKVEARAGVFGGLRKTIVARGIIAAAS